MGDPHQDVPTRDQIQLRAYELYVQRGRGDGRDLEDWLAAEKELRIHHSSSTGTSHRQDAPSSTEKRESRKTFAAAGNPKAH